MSDPIELRGSTFSLDDSPSPHFSQNVAAHRRREDVPQSTTGHYRAIFKQLKPTSRGTLNCATVTRCNLTDEQAIFLRPVLEKLVTSDLEMEFKEFASDLAYLQKVKGVKDITLVFPRGNTPISSLPRTRNSSNSKLKIGEIAGFYNRQVAQQQMKHQFLWAVRKRLEEKELAECTFKPKIKKVCSSRQESRSSYRRSHRTSSATLC
jgi:hypothetical protein